MCVKQTEKTLLTSIILLSQIIIFLIMTFADKIYHIIFFIFNIDKKYTGLFSHSVLGAMVFERYLYKEEQS